MRDRFFFNEESARSRVDSGLVGSVYADFADMTQVLRKARPSSRLVSTESLQNVAIGGLSFGDWGAQGSNRDLWRIVMGSLAGPPAACWEFRASQIDRDVSVSASIVSTESANAALTTGSLLVSLGSNSELKSSDLSCVVEQIVEGELLTTNAILSHAYSADSGEDYLRSTPPEALPVSAADLWGRREVLYPHLEFLEIVGSEVRGIPENWLDPMAKRLAELEAATAAWDRNQHPMPSWRSQVTGESGSRRSQFWFSDGQELELFEMHARFTPGYGRIYFRVLRDRGVLRIAHVGEHR